MVLVDTSVWISHFKKANTPLTKLLLEEAVICHPLIIGEIACGHISNREEVLSLLEAIPSAKVAEFDEILHFIESRSLFGLGVGIVDVHLLAASLLSKTPIWTLDNKLQKVASRLNVSYEPT